MSGAIIFFKHLISPVGVFGLKEIKIDKALIVSASFPDILLAFINYTENFYISIDQAIFSYSFDLMENVYLL